MFQPRLVLVLGLFSATWFGHISPSIGSDWQVVSVPGEHPIASTVWFRTWLKPHASFFSRHERDLFGESVIFQLRGVNGAHEVWINGTSIGRLGVSSTTSGEKPTGHRQYKIPPGTFVADHWNEITIRIDPDDQGVVFQDHAPFVMNYFWECVLEGQWESQVLDQPPSFGEALKEKPSRSAFERFNESSQVLAAADSFVHGEKMSPSQSLAQMKTPDDLQVELMLSEPLVAQPTHFSFDSRGRLWVSQYRQYPFPAGLKMISRDRYYRSHYDRVPPPPPNHDRGRDRISIHEDTDGDGRYDKHSIFQDELNMANAAVRGRSGVWVINTPYLLFYPDADFDDVPDGPPVVHLKGFGMEDSHSVANGLVWGMDGWLYGAQGSTTTCHITRPGIDADDEPGIYFQGCMVWRYHPESRRFEIFSEGGGNNFGLEVDSGGRLFTGNNGGQTRGFHYIQGGLHLMQGTTPNKFGPVRNQFAFGQLPFMATEQPIPRFTHFATLVESTAMPAPYQNTFLSVEPLHNFVIASRRHVAGATFRTSDTVKVLTSDDFAFRPVYIGGAPDGSVLVADFYEHYIAHGQHYQSQIDPTTGRIYRIRGVRESLISDLNLHSKSSDELIALLAHPNRWHRHTAVRLLGERRDPDTREKLQGLVRRGNELEALAAIWALYQAFGLDANTATIALQHRTPMVRYWAVRLICDDIGFANRRQVAGLESILGAFENGPDRVADGLFDVLVTIALNETDAEVRSQIAASARRLPVDQALKLVALLLQHDEDIDDAYVPLLCWWVLETSLDRDRDAVVDLFDDPEFRRQPMVVEHILSRTMRALALKGGQTDLRRCARLLELADQSAPINALLAGFEAAYEGRTMTGLPDELGRALIQSGRSSLALKVRLGDTEATKEANELLVDEQADVDERTAMARTLGEVKQPESLEPLLDVATSIQNSQLQRAALIAISGFDHPSIGPRLIAAFDQFTDDVRPAFFDAMLSREPWAIEFVEALASKRIPVANVSLDVADQLRRSTSDQVSEMAVDVFGPLRTPVLGESKERIERIRNVIVDGTGNPYLGEAIYLQRCANCHRLFHKGGNVGPDLTPYQRGDLGTLLNSVIQPSAEIREGYEQVMLLTVDGRVVTGFLTDRDSQVTTLRGKSGEDIRIESDDIESIEPVGRSLMPDGLLDDLNDQQVRDFFAYLRISQPISD
ncbi:PVC-type heme-binding CxxCH protein [Neorhodopirellula pilleata]|uniref:Cytochrome c domain-containing protein n=1 Tax=Neorhodopirellula pilleata TaxID=2714738 RepID=A0A5C5ZY67_9BACT|nr:PVC-type heme-binding CxxCH protein [Neorhodopirellula pilleata]TWT92614.1 hypothetical protein Pla100_46340 [Neorhodopirellula pilleata]